MNKAPTEQPMNAIKGCGSETQAAARKADPKGAKLPTIVTCPNKTEQQNEIVAYRNDFERNFSCIGSTRLTEIK